MQPSQLALGSGLWASCDPIIKQRAGGRGLTEHHTPTCSPGFLWSMNLSTESALATEML